MQINMRHEVIFSCLLALTEEHLQFNETAYKTVKVDGIMSISITTDYGLQHCAVDVETWGRKIAVTYHHFLLARRASFIDVGYFWSRGSIVFKRGVILAG